jgi:hypothetical protein
MQTFTEVIQLTFSLTYFDRVSWHQNNVPQELNKIDAYTQMKQDPQMLLALTKKFGVWINFYTAILIRDTTCMCCRSVVLTCSNSITSCVSDGVMISSADIRFPPRCSDKRLNNDETKHRNDEINSLSVEWCRYVLFSRMQSYKHL